MGWIAAPNEFVDAHDQSVELTVSSDTGMGYAIVDVFQLNGDGAGIYLNVEQINDLIGALENAKEDIRTS